MIKVTLIVMAFVIALVSLVSAQQSNFGFGQPNGFRRGPGGFNRGPGGGFGRGPGGFGRNPPGNGAGNNNPDNCPSICPAIYTPTCGFDGTCYKSFGNPCELGAAACTGRGKFRQVAVSECSRPGNRIC